jgi:hypothetical protein
MKNQERTNRIIARGEGSNHAHVITGDAKVERNTKGEIIIQLGNERTVLKHILESEWMKGNEVWTGEHDDINLSEIDSKIKIGEIGIRHGDVGLEKLTEKTYKYVPQVEFDPFEKIIRRVKD